MPSFHPSSIPLFHSSKGLFQTSIAGNTLTVNKYSLALLTFLLAAFSLISDRLSAAEPKIERLLQTTQSWDGKKYPGYPAGQPQITVLKITIPPHTALHWHRHPMISVAYVLSGHLTLEKKETRERKVFHSGDALAETLQTTHRGFTTNEPVQLIVFYAGRVGLPLSIVEE